MGIPEKIKAIQDEILRTQLNKATEHHIGLLKAKIAKLKREQEADQADRHQAHLAAFQWTPNFASDDARDDVTASLCVQRQN